MVNTLHGEGIVEKGSEEKGRSIVGESHFGVPYCEKEVL